MILQPVVDIAEICARKGIRNAIICPGSRNAPLTLAFARHPDIQCYSVSDERSAAFIGLGMAMKSQAPVVLICTSGSAAYNLSPAVAEAYFSQIPLLVITADRPKEWIAQLDGQTIFQREIYGKHAKRSFEFPSDYNHPDAVWHCHRICNEAINEAVAFPQGPCHINVAFREPFYPEQGETFTYSKDLRITEVVQFKAQLRSWGEAKGIENFKRILIAGGQAKFSRQLNAVLSDISHRLAIPVAADVISNLHQVKEAISAHDVFLKNKKLKPDLLITYGKSLISKNLKLFLRQASPQCHWHIQPAGEAADTFQCLTKIIRCAPLDFFQYLAENKAPADREYFINWQQQQSAKAALNDELRKHGEFNEFRAFKQVLDALPSHIDLHLANSMAVRYANFIGIGHKEGIEVFANRGTSGIDGSTSTAIGSALSTDRKLYLLTGDFAFFYDRNAFWHNHLPANLKIIVLNNHGGGIFRIIDGPPRQPELKEFFETDQRLSARHLAGEYNIAYRKCENFHELSMGIHAIIESESTFILEIITDAAANEKVFKEVLGKF